MQKVVGSSPISRFGKPCKAQGFFVLAAKAHLLLRTQKVKGSGRVPETPRPKRLLQRWAGLVKSRGARTAGPGTSSVPKHLASEVERSVGRLQNPTASMRGCGGPSNRARAADLSLGDALENSAERPELLSAESAQRRRRRRENRVGPPG